MKIGIFVRTKYDPQYEEFKSSKGTPVIIEKLIIKHLKKNKPQHEYIVLDAHNIDTKLAKKCDIVWFSFEDFTNILKEQIHIRSEDSKKSLKSYNNTIKKITNIPNIYPNKKYLKFIHDKCSYYNWLKNKNITVAPTYCVKTNNYKLKDVMSVMNKWSKTVFKPVLGGESKGFQIYNKPYKPKEVSKYFDDARKAQYPAVIIQKFMKNFSTKKNPEIRTIWVGKNLTYAVHTYKWGDPIKLTKKVNPKIKALGLKVIKELEKEFKMKLTSLRIDFGKDSKGNFFVNELEHGFGTFAEINKKISNSLPNKIATTFAKNHKL
tara:strand:- start:11239 stop:12198 length:960 start_codon:yes stop_codon:yes gene_type:complete